MESFSDDSLVVAELAGITDALGGAGALAGKRLNSVKHDIVESTRQYFSQLSEDQVQRLKGLYAMDFELFGYSAETYL